MAFIVVTTVLINSDFHSSHVEMNENGAVVMFIDKTMAQKIVDGVIETMLEEVVGEGEMFLVEHDVEDLGGGSKIVGTTTEVYVTLQEVTI
jgi:hypothetical protein